MLALALAVASDHEPALVGERDEHRLADTEIPAGPTNCALLWSHGYAALRCRPRRTVSSAIRAASSSVPTSAAYLSAASLAYASTWHAEQ